MAAVQLLDFWSPTCGPCKSLEPHLNAFEEANKGIVEVVNINTKDPSNAAIKQKFRIRAVPTMVLLRDGVEISRSKGAMASHAQIRNWVSKFNPSVK